MKLKDKPSASDNQPKPPKSTNSGKRCIRFEVEAPQGSAVFVAGDFNDWKKTSHRMSDRGHPGIFRRNVYVEPGRFEYKFLINDEWQIDSGCEQWCQNRFGSLNSVIEI